MGCSESTPHDDVLEQSVESTAAQTTVDIDTSMRVSGASSKPIGFSRVAETRRKRRQQEEDAVARDTNPPSLPPGERASNVPQPLTLPAAIAPPNPLSTQSRPLIFDGDSSVSPMHSGNSVFSSDEPPAADQQTVAYNDDALSQTSLASSAPVLSPHTSHSGTPEFFSNGDGSGKARVDDDPSALPSMLP